MRPWPIARKYLTSFFPMDLVIITTEWMSAAEHRYRVLGENLPLMRMCKVFRFLRIISVLRVLKTPNIMSRTIWRYVGPNSRGLVNETSLLLCGIAWMSHIIACTWYLLGKHGDSDTGERWTRTKGIHGKLFNETGPWHNYWTALHWSTAQTFQGGIELFPQNTTETQFNVFIVFLGIVIFSTTFSLVSTNIMQFRLSRQDLTEKIAMLRKMLRECKVSAELSLSVEKQFMEKMNEKRPVGFKDVPGIKDLPMKLQMELKSEVVGEHLQRQPLLRVWRIADRNSCHRLCHEAIDHIPFARGDVIFLPGKVATGTYYATRGVLEYEQDPASSLVDEKRTRTVTDLLWVSQAALWSHWQHVGRLEAESVGEVLTINAESFVEAASASSVMKLIISQYGKSYHEQLISAGPASGTGWPDDLEVPFTDYEEIIWSLPRTTRINIGAVTMHEMKRMWGWRRADLIDLGKEVSIGKSVIMIDSYGDVIRATTLALMRLVGEGGLVFAQVGKWRRDQSPNFEGSCELPGSKQQEGERPDATMKRFLRDSVSGLGNGLDFSKTDRDIAWKSSAKYGGVRTKYIKTLFHATLRANFELPGRREVLLSRREVIPSARVPWKMPSSRNITSSRHPSRKTSERLCPTEIFIFCEPLKETARVFAWLYQEDFDILVDAPEYPEWVQVVTDLARQAVLDCDNLKASESASAITQASVSGNTPTTGQPG